MLEIKTNPFDELLAEALRAGPGSAAWREAVAQLGTVTEAADEYQALLSARENLESGKPYRSVRAGAGFTRKVMDGLDHQDTGRASRGIPTAPIIAVLAVIGIICALGWLGIHLVPRPESGHGGLSELANTYFSTQIAEATFDGSIPASWRQIGGLPLEFHDGLRPGAAGESPGGGVVLATPLPADEPFAFEAQLRIAHSSDALVAQVFVSSTGDFSQDRATSSHELLWTCRGKAQEVVLDGRVLPITSPPLHDGSTVQVRILMNLTRAIVEVDGQRLWAGPYDLGADPRWLGVRFIRSGSARSGGIELRSAKVFKR
jgi:hypothetical protein